VKFCKKECDPDNLNEKCEKRCKCDEKKKERGVCEDTRKRVEYVNMNGKTKKKRCTWAWRMNTEFRCQFKEIREKCPHACNPECKCHESKWKMTFDNLSGKEIKKGCAWAGIENTSERCTIEEVASKCRQTCSPECQNTDDQPTDDDGSSTDDQPTDDDGSSIDDHNDTDDYYSDDEAILSTDDQQSTDDDGSSTDDQNNTGDGDDTTAIDDDNTAIDDDYYLTYYDDAILELSTDDQQSTDDDGSSTDDQNNTDDGDTDDVYYNYYDDVYYDDLPYYSYDDL
jgi:hypothetical protein